MIQRIQTVYILISIILIGLLFAFPFADIVEANTVYEFNAFGIQGVEGMANNGWAAALLIGIIELAHLIALFSFKKRIRQIRMLTFSILLCIGLIGLFFFVIFKSFEDPTVSYKVTLLFPVFAIIFDYLAIRAIGKDEALVRSLDRIR